MAGGHLGAVEEVAASGHCPVEEVVEEASRHLVEVEEVEGVGEAHLEDKGREDLQEHWLFVSC